SCMPIAFRSGSNRASTCSKRKPQERSAKEMEPPERATRPAGCNYAMDSGQAGGERFAAPNRVWGGKAAVPPRLRRDQWREEAARTASRRTLACSFTVGVGKLIINQRIALDR